VHAAAISILALLGLPRYIPAYPTLPYVTLPHCNTLASVVLWCYASEAMCRVLTLRYPTLPYDTVAP
jgi:hypothetical protein